MTIAIVFLDDDDQWLPDYLTEAIPRVMERNLDVLCCDFVGVSATGDVVPGKSAPQQLSADLFLTENPGMIGSNLVMRKELSQEIGGFDETSAPPPWWHATIDRPHETEGRWHSSVLPNSFSSDDSRAA